MNPQPGNVIARSAAKPAPAEAGAAISTRGTGDCRAALATTRSADESFISSSAVFRQPTAGCRLPTSGSETIPGRTAGPRLGTCHPSLAASPLDIPAPSAIMYLGGVALEPPHEEYEAIEHIGTSRMARSGHNAFTEFPQVKSGSVMYEICPYRQNVGTNRSSKGGFGLARVHDFALLRRGDNEDSGFGFLGRPSGRPRKASLQIAVCAGCANGLGEWAQSLSEILAGPTSQLLSAAARDEQRELTQKYPSGSWQHEAVRLLCECRSDLADECDPPAKVSAKDWFGHFVAIRNRTRGHGALTGAGLQQGMPKAGEYHPVDG